jgi:hypothetical protein
MRAFQSIEYVGVCLVGVIFFSPSLFAADRHREPAKQPPAVEPRFQAGDTLAIASEGADLMLGEQVIAVLSRGKRIVVVEVRDAWVGTHVIVQGEKKAGWVRVHDFLPPAGAAKRGERAVAGADSVSQAAYTTADSVVSEAAEAAPRVSQPGSRPVEREYRDAFLIGKYDRHETDPNVHVWEPWRH